MFLSFTVSGVRRGLLNNLINIVRTHPPAQSEDRAAVDRVSIFTDDGDSHGVETLLQHEGIVNFRVIDTVPLLECDSVIWQVVADGDITHRIPYP